MITKENISHLEDMIWQVSSMIDWVNSNTQSSKRLALVKELVNSRRRLKRIYYAMIDNPTIAAFGESHDRGSRAIAFRIRNYLRFPMFHDRHAAVGGPEVDT